MSSEWKPTHRTKPVEVMIEMKPNGTQYFRTRERSYSIPLTKHEFAELFEPIPPPPTVTITHALAMELRHRLTESARDDRLYEALVEQMDGDTKEPKHGN